MFTKIHTATMHGLSCNPITVEVDIAGSWPGFHIVGLADVAVQEAKERIRTAWKNAGLQFPGNSKIVINLAPANVKKIGTGFDLPMAVGMYLSTTHQDISLQSSLMLGELALDGSLRRTAGVLPIVLYAREVGFETVYIPEENKLEVSMLKGINIIPVPTLAAMIDHITGKNSIEPIIPTEQPLEQEHIHTTDMADVKGQEFVKRALEIAAAGGHNILLNGPPGSGKTLLARTFPSILPNMTEQEAIDVTKIYSIAGLLPPHTALITNRPFRAPHHSASGVSLVGGGKFPRPGEISLAHRGVLFLDEFPEFPRPVLENLRQPLEDGIVTISRVQGTCEFPADFILVASKNPCPCGFATDHERTCTCSPMSIDRYQKKLSGPLLDRIDLHVEVPRVPFEKLKQAGVGETSATIRARVEAARNRQKFRFQQSPTVSNSSMTLREIQDHCPLGEDSLKLLKMAMTQFQLSARSYNRMLKVARTIADLAKAEMITPSHIAEAIQYRTKEV